MSPDPTIAGVILAGGTGSRMFPQFPLGGEKGLVPLAGRPLLAHAVERVKPQVARLVINTNAQPGLYERFGLPVIADAVAGQGPLAGLLAAMAWAKANGLERESLLSVSSDTPFVPPDLAARLHTAYRDAGELKPVIAQSAGRLHPVIGLWPLSLHASLEAALNAGQRGAERFARTNGAIAVSFAFVTIGGESIDPFFNANTPEDLARAESWLSRQ